MKMIPTGRKFYLICFVLFLVFLSGCQSEESESGGGGTPVTPSPPQQEPDLAQDTIPEAGFSETEQSQYSSFEVLDSAEYQINQSLALANHGPGSPSKQNLWVALIQDIYPYQEVIQREITPDSFQLIVDEYGNQVAEFDFSGMPADTEIEVEINYRVKVNQLKFELSDCQGELPGFFTEPELHIESRNPQIMQLSGQLSQSKSSTCDQVRAFYDYIGDHLVYSFNGANWGAQGALGEMGADCTEYSSLLIALSRAAGIPARYMLGLSYMPEGEAVLARQEHAWVEVYLSGIGWVPIDPTLGRSSIYRGSYFARLPADHIIVSRGRNPSTMRGGSYWTYIYWPGDSADIKLEEGSWVITPFGE